MLVVKNCTKRFRKKVAVDSLSIVFKNGVTGLLGPNGAGKTTLLRCICGLYSLDTGSIETGGGKIGYLPQQFGMFRGLTLYQMMEYFAAIKEIPKNKAISQIERCIELVNLSDRLNSKVSELSGGMVRRAGIAQAILGDPEIIILDEPTAGLDPEERVRLKNVISKIQAQKTILLSTHIVSDVEALCNRVIIMNEGKMAAQGSTEEIAHLGSGKVYDVAEKNESQLQGNFFIKDRQEENGERLLRVLSPVEQPGEQVKPTMEDGYLCVIKSL